MLQQVATSNEGANGGVEQGFAVVAESADRDAVDAVRGLFMPIDSIDNHPAPLCLYSRFNGLLSNKC